MRLSILRAEISVKSEKSSRVGNLSYRKLQFAKMEWQLYNNSLFAKVVLAGLNLIESNKV